MPSETSVSGEAIGSSKDGVGNGANECDAVATADGDGDCVGKVVDDSSVRGDAVGVMVRRGVGWTLLVHAASAKATRTTRAVRRITFL